MGVSWGVWVFGWIRRRSGDGVVRWDCVLAVELPFAVVV